LRGLSDRDLVWVLVIKGEEGEEEAVDTPECESLRE
jgi:hypothetical protein